MILSNLLSGLYAGIKRAVMIFCFDFVYLKKHTVKDLERRTEIMGAERSSIRSIIDESKSKKDDLIDLMKDNLDYSDIQMKMYLSKLKDFMNHYQTDHISFGAIFVEGELVIFHHGYKHIYFLLIQQV